MQHFHCNNKTLLSYTYPFITVSSYLTGLVGHPVLPARFTARALVLEAKEGGILVNDVGAAVRLLAIAPLTS